MMKRIVSRMLRDWKSNLFWMVVQLCAAYTVGAIALRLLASYGVGHPYIDASMLGFAAYCVVVGIQAWHEQVRPHRKEIGAKPE